MAHRLESMHPTKEKADKFAAKLKRMGAKGVRVGKKTKEGYPVSSIDPAWANIWKF